MGYTFKAEPRDLLLDWTANRTEPEVVKNDTKVSSLKQFIRSV